MILDIDSISDDDVEAARKAIEGVLVELRDARVSLVGRGNGLCIRERDGTPSDVIRLGAEDAMRIGLKAIADHRASKPMAGTESECRACQGFGGLGASRRCPACGSTGDSATPGDKPRHPRCYGEGCPWCLLHDSMPSKGPSGPPDFGGYWWASLCSAHQTPQFNECETCRTGSWVRDKPMPSKGPADV